MIFKIFLPASAQSAAALERSAPESQVRGGHETILLVEDEAVLRGLTKVVLESYGYRVIEAGSGVEALLLWETQDPEIDLLLTDMVMPEGLTGRELATHLKELRPALKVIFVSGYSLDSEEITRGLCEGAPFLQKPCQPRVLLQTIRDCLDKKLG